MPQNYAAYYAAHYAAPDVDILILVSSSFLTELDEEFR